MTVTRESTGKSVTAAYGGDKWDQRLNSFRQDMPLWWGDWGVSSECGDLQGGATPPAGFRARSH